ncbi:NADH:flavin oxidoreductase/NADH oxidase [Pseudoclavibacter chungangensis]|uniref:NADH:flavin oxidoreductase/NADH oxidase n=1 Tax=Pseudoclavibacter chungangensis TaxID=587635 RepID=A0A7J5BUG8_9MICO|nr:NADH:flavin oxidoreductase/NADH oxidase [Pseudoclavibacter chungangensis]KAB1657773.1 NADH:flavin oxidoreductase/NADH oxidase [Pseudoclavibacter chungangensis]NYJ66640.1 2,4-dienoyl-CoA reductase-like NADH-dependent reductase (Old Yellow Enzyme family) [Pseudoclavibacter chungangensis]
MTATHLFTPFDLRGTTFRHRLWVSPMCQYSAVDGVPGAWHLVHYGSFATGGAALVVTEKTAVVPEGRISPACTGIWSDAQREAWRPIVAFAHEQGARIGIQLGHAGRKASTEVPWRGRGSVPIDDGGWPTVAPSPLAFDGLAAPRALGEDELPALVAAWRAAAGRAVDAGFDVVELHFAHGYLVHQFLSPLSNVREDGYGGDAAGRARLAIEIARAVRDEIGPSVPLFARVSATDWVPGGLDVDDTVRIASWLREAGVDLVDVSGGGLDPRQRIPELAPGYQVPLARAVRDGADVPVTAVGLLTTGAQMEEVLASGAADAVFVGREHLRDPHLPQRVAHELGDSVPWVPQYERAAYRQG